MPRFPSNDIISLIGKLPKFDLGGSYGPILSPNEVLDDALHARLTSIQLRYASAQGEHELREAIALICGAAPDDVVVTTGSAQAIFLLAFILCGREDEVVLESPCFPPTVTAFEVTGANVRKLALSFDNGYRFHIDDFKPLLNDRTKFVCLTSPQNPSGVAVPQQTIAEIATMMDSTCPQAYLLVDEIYRDAAFGDEPFAPTALGLGPKVIVVSSLSKAYGAPGLRIGWAITKDAELREQLTLAKFYTSISCPVIDEQLALAVLRNREDLLTFRRRFLQDCLDCTAKWVESNGNLIEWVPPDASPICCIRLRPSVFVDADVERFYELLETYEVRVARGDWFGESARVFRLAFAHLPIEQYQVALDALSAALQQASSSKVLSG